MQRNLNEIQLIRFYYLKNNKHKHIEDENERQLSEKNHDGHCLVFEELLFSQQRVNKNSINWLWILTERTH